MGYKDPRAPFLAVSLNVEPEVDPAMAQAERVFAELAFDMGLSEPDLMMQGPGAEEATLIYDKFSGRRR